MVPFWRDFVSKDMTIDKVVCTFMKQDAELLGAFAYRRRAFVSFGTFSAWSNLSVAGLRIEMQRPRTELQGPRMEVRQDRVHEAGLIL